MWLGTYFTGRAVSRLGYVSYDYSKEQDVCLNVWKINIRDCVLDWIVLEKERNEKKDCSAVSLFKQGSRDLNFGTSRPATVSVNPNMVSPGIPSLRPFSESFSKTKDEIYDHIVICLENQIAWRKKIINLFQTACPQKKVSLTGWNHSPIKDRRKPHNQ